MKSITIRKAKEEDIPGIVEVSSYLYKRFEKLNTKDKLVKGYLASRKHRNELRKEMRQRKIASLLPNRIRTLSDFFRLGLWIIGQCSKLGKKGDSRC